MRAPYVIAVLLVLFNLSVHGQTQPTSNDQKPCTPTNSPSRVGLDTDTDQGVKSSGFATRFPWYVRVIQVKVREKWIKYEGDPAVQSAHRVYVAFDINHKGEPSNARITQSSGVPSLDESALRAVSSVSTFGLLPPDWEMDKVSVLFWFDYKPKTRNGLNCVN